MVPRTRTRRRMRARDSSSPPPAKRAGGGHGNNTDTRIQGRRRRWSTNCANSSPTTAGPTTAPSPPNGPGFPGGKALRPRACPTPGNLSTLDAIRARWAEVEREQQAFIDALGEDDLRRAVSYRDIRGQPFTNTMAQMLRHVVNH